jgi:hypothetical protein
MKGPVYAVLGNHDTIRMTPGLEAIDIPVLLNESLGIERGGERVHLGGVGSWRQWDFSTSKFAACGVACKIRPAKRSLVLSQGGYRS